MDQKQNPIYPTSRFNNYEFVALALSSPFYYFSSLFFAEVLRFEYFLKQIPDIISFLPFTPGCIFEKQPPFVCEVWLRRQWPTCTRGTDSGQRCRTAWVRWQVCVALWHQVWVLSHPGSQTFWVPSKPSATFSCWFNPVLVCQLLLSATLPT